MIFVTGGAGFIGSNFVLDWLAQSDESVINFDKLTYAGNLNNLATLRDDPRHIFVHGDICDTALVATLLARHKPRAIVHLAAESHVDRSIHSPGAFVTTNVNGTFGLRIPRQSGHQFHAKAATDSTAIWPLIPRQSGHPFHGKAATHSTANRPPFVGRPEGHELA
jgi:dTDP-D-glucose 4,6-dehydratase